MSIICRVIVLVCAAAISSPQAAASPPTSQPAGEQTLIHAMIVQFTPTEAVSAPEVRRQLGFLNNANDISKVLKRRGKIEVLSRPSILVRWPQQATIQIGERLPRGTGKDVAYDDVGLKCTVDGHWLSDQPRRGHLQIKVDYSYLTGMPVQTVNDPLPIEHEWIEKTCLIIEGKPCWLVMPTRTHDAKVSYHIIGLTAHRVRNDAKPGLTPLPEPPPDK